MLTLVIVTLKPYLDSTQVVVCMASRKTDYPWQQLQEELLIE